MYIHTNVHVHIHTHEKKYTCIHACGVLVVSGCSQSFLYIPKLVGFGNGQSGWDIDTMILFKFLSKFVSNKSLVPSANWLFLGGGAQTTI
jgi:hypothetical protein